MKAFKVKTCLCGIMMTIGSSCLFAAATENVIGDPQSAVASGIRLYSENANHVLGFEIDGTYYEGFVTIYPQTYPVQYRVKPVLAAGKYLYRDSRKKGSCGITADTDIFPGRDNAYWMIPPPRGEGALEVITNYFQVAQTVLWVDKANGNDDTNDGSTNSPYASIQRAVDAVSGTTRTVIMVHPGEYDTNGGTSEKYGNARVYVSGTHQLCIRSVAGAANTSIVGASDAGGNDPDYPGCGANAWRCVLCENKSYPVQIQGFTLKNGRSGLEGSGATGGAFLGIRDERLEDCVIRDCVSQGALVAISSGSVLSVARCRFLDNTAYQYILNTGGSFSYLRGNTILLTGSGTTGAINTYAYNCTAVGEVKSGRLAGTAQHWDSIYDGGNNLYSSISGGGDIFFNYNHNYIQDDNMTSYRLEDPCFVDRATDGVVCAHSPAVGFGEAFSAEAYRAEFWKVFNGDIDGRAMVIDANGKTLAGAFQQTVVRSVVTLNEPTKGGLALEKGEFGENVLYEGDELVIVSAPGTRPCDGVTINGTTNILFETAPEHKIVLTCDVLGSGDSFTVVPHYTTDWYVDDDGDDGNSGGYPSASRKTLATTAALLSSGDTLHVLPGEYRTETTEAKDLPCRVVVKQGTRIVSTDGPEVTFICGETGVRCARVEKNAELSGFTLKSADITASGKTGAAVIGSGDTGGRGPANGHKVSNCIITGNRGQWPVYSCLLIRSRVTGNVAVTSEGKDAALCYQISAYGSYFAGNTCLRVFDYSLDMHDITIAADNLTSGGDPAGAVVNSVANSLLANSLVLIPGNYNANSSITNSILAAKSSINEAASLGSDVVTNAKASDYPLDADGAPVVGANAAIDAAKPDLTAKVFPRAEKDARGFQRVMNGRGDIGAMEADWRPRFAADLGRPRQLTVTKADPQVVETVGGVAISNGVMEVAWSNDLGGKADYSLAAEVSGAGTLTVTLNGETLRTLTAEDGPCTVSFANDFPVNALGFAFEPVANEPGAAVLSHFRRSGAGLMLIFR